MPLELPIYVNILSLVVRVITLLFCFFALHAFARVLRAQVVLATERSSRYSPTLVLYVVLWVLSLLALCPYLGYLIVSWSPTSESPYDYSWLYANVPVQIVPAARNGCSGRACSSTR